MLYFGTAALYRMILIFIYIHIVQCTDTCFAVPQLISVAWYNLYMAWQLHIYTQAIVSDNRLQENYVVLYGSTISLHDKVLTLL